ncbi:ArsI/CadI family heavy metal resistance metalloenzyme [Thermasporomyces composti]|jgi:catechol 2,3-dioxygenase-like lactoylglutathione lyase family enzyme|uniref:Catechol 2,3-dioxygenase-like lactoylglutathione lyase family enzyme n=1 Tax=Thermasporomyces composti TaxID=696763 RepID=A0A3D9V1U2_THECX|nr:ArsI/CadI family heavy metal resistance metalloenzyme [Thermasporomyces composti]REF35758.1 catechol 2,3-dioxygenase-like lactoylglutathione lyase family enzyme [Thermasporomyces composti]
MSRVQLALRVSDLDRSVAFYTTLFGVEPAKRRPRYANFAVENPPLKLVLLEGEPDQPTVMDHLGVEVFSTDDVDAATKRLSDAGLVAVEEKDTECCYALQDKVWVRGPGGEPWEFYTVKADSDRLEKTAACCASATAQTSATQQAPACASGC